MKKTKISTCALALASLIAANNAVAITYNWSAESESSYSHYDLWTIEEGGGLTADNPTSADIFVNDTAATLKFDGTGDDWVTGALWLGLTNGTAPQVSQTSGKLVFGGELYYDAEDEEHANPKYRNNGVKIGVAEGSSATYELLGGTVLTNGMVVGQAGHGKLDVSGGAIIVGTLRSEADGGTLIDGVRYNLGTTYVGVNRADVNPENPGQNPYPGGVNSYGTMNISAGKFWGGDIRLGEGADGSGPGIETGQLNISDTGALELSGQLYVGNSGGEGIVNQTGGSVKAWRVTLAQYLPNSKGTYNLSGGTLETTNELIMSSNNGTSEFNLSGGTLTAGHHLTMSNGTGSTSTFNYTGGEMILKKDLIMSNNGATSTFDMSDGLTLKVGTDGGWMYVGNGSVSGGPAGNATFTGGDNVTIEIGPFASNPNHDMLLQVGKNSTGVMTLGNNATIKTGRISVGNRDNQWHTRPDGTLTLGTNATIATNGIFVIGNGATGVVTIGNNSNITIGGELHVGNDWNGRPSDNDKDARQGNGTMTVGAGSNVTVNDWVAIGREGAKGTLNLNGTVDNRITFTQNPTGTKGNFEIGNNNGYNTSVLSMTYTDLTAGKDFVANRGQVTINIDHSTLNITNNLQLARGENQTDIGHTTMTVTESTITAGGELAMGRTGFTGELILNNSIFTSGANHSKPAASIGIFGSGKGTSTGVITQNGTSTATFNGELRLAQTTESSGTYNLNGGTLTANYTVSVARGGTGVLNMADGTTLIKGNGVTSVAGAGITGDGKGSNAGDLGNGTAQGTYTPFIIAWGGTGTFNQNGGTLTFVDRENTQMWVGYAENEERNTPANATWNMNAGVANIGLLQLGKDHTEKLNVTSVVNLNGGVISTSRIDAGTADNITATFNFNGGTLQAGVNDAEGILITSNVDTVNVKAAGGIIDTMARNVKIQSEFTSDGDIDGTYGDIEKIGTGALILDVAQTQFQGGFNVTAGTLDIQAAVTVGQNVVIAAGAALTVHIDGLSIENAEGTIAIADASPTLNFEGGSTLVLAAGATLNVVVTNSGSITNGAIFNVFTGGVTITDTSLANVNIIADDGRAYTLGANGTLTVVPEPSTYALFGGMALLGLALIRRRKK